MKVLTTMNPSPPTNMSTVKGWVGASGGGKGLQLPSGRLVFACGGKACWSDDHGASWQNGSTAPLGPGVGGFGAKGVWISQDADDESDHVRVLATAGVSLHTLAVADSPSAEV